MMWHRHCLNLSAVVLPIGHALSWFVSRKIGKALRRGVCEQGIYKTRVDSVVRVRKVHQFGSEDQWVRPDARGLAWDCGDSECLKRDICGPLFIGATREIKPRLSASTRDGTGD